MSIELYLAVNWIADFALLASVSRSLGLFSWRRALWASLLCAAYALLAARQPDPWAGAPVQLALLAAVSLFLSRGSPAFLRGICALCLGACALLCGGVAALAPQAGPSAAMLGVGAGTLTATLLFALRPPQRSIWQVRLCLAGGGRTARFEALIDTGNRLREPWTGLPVLIAEASLIRNVLPESGYRTLRFDGMGGEGRMSCFRPEGLWIERRGHRQRAPEVWVAVSQDPLPGLCQALAPPEFALYGN